MDSNDNNQQTTEQTKAVALQAQENEKKFLQAVVDSVTVTSPHLKDKLTIPAIWAFMRLPDSSFGWAEKSGKPLMWEMKAMAVITTLRLGLVPGLGHVNFLGNALAVNTAGKRHIALTSPDFRFMGPRTIRMITDTEKQMLDWKEGDRALAIEDVIELKGRAIAVTGYAIIEESQLKHRSNGYSLPGLANKKDIYQTLVTRAENDIYKHWLPLEGVDQNDYDEPINVTPTPPERPVLQKLNEEGEKKAVDHEMQKACGEFRSLVEKIGPSRSASLLGINTMQIVEITSGKTKESADEIWSAIDVLRDNLPPDNDPTEPPKTTRRPRAAKQESETTPTTTSPQPGASVHTGSAAGPVPPAASSPATSSQSPALEMIARLAADLRPEEGEIAERLKELSGRILKEGDELRIVPAVRIARQKGRMQDLDSLIDSRMPIPFG